MDATAGDRPEPLDIVKGIRAHMAAETERLSVANDKRLQALRWEYEHDSRDRDAVEAITDDGAIRQWLWDALAVLDE